MKLLALFLLITVSAFGQSRTWTSQDGRTIEAVYVKHDKVSVTLIREGETREISIPLAKITPADRDWLDARPRPAVRANTVTIIANLRQLDSKATTWKTDYGSYNKEFAAIRILEVETRTTDRDRDPAATLYYGFVAFDVEGNFSFLHSAGKMAINIGKDKMEIQSAAMAGTDDKYAALGERNKSGERPNGWACYIVNANGEIAAAASTPEFVERFRAHVKAMADKLEADKKKD